MTAQTKMYRATRALFVGRARAHNAGDLVTAAAVKRGGWEKDVEAAEPVAAEERAVPAKSASKSEWVAHATHPDRGPDQLTPEDAEALNRDQLAELFTT